MTEHHYERRKHFAFRTPSDSSVFTRGLAGAYHRCPGTLGNATRGPCWGKRSSAGTVTAEQPRKGKPAPGLIPLSPGGHLVLPRALLPPRAPSQLVHRAPAAGQPGCGPLPRPHALDGGIQHTAKRLCDKCGRYKPVSKPLNPRVHLLPCTKPAETLSPAPLELLSTCWLGLNHDIHKEPACLITPSLTKMPSQVICSNTLQLLSFAHIANTRHRLQDVHHPKCERQGRCPPLRPGKVPGLGVGACRKVALGRHRKMVLFLRAHWERQCP